MTQIETKEIQRDIKGLEIVNEPCEEHTATASIKQTGRGQLAGCLVTAQAKFCHLHVVFGKDIRELKQTRRRRKRERQMKM